MRILHLEFDHVKLFKDGIFTFDFFAENRVPKEDESVTLLDRPIYHNNVIAIAGVNASGKTTVLKLLGAALDILKGFAPSADLCSLFEKQTTAHILFWSRGKTYLLNAHLVEDQQAVARDGRSALRFASEILYRIDGTLQKKHLLDITTIQGMPNCHLVENRQTLEEEKHLLLGDDGSIVRILHDAPGSLFIDAFDHPGSIGQVTGSMDEILRTFDPSIEHIEIHNTDSFNLRFAHSDEELRLSAAGIEKVLSSGTLKGHALIRRVFMALSYGSYCLVDEIEVHLNKQLVAVIIELFSSHETNPHGAVLVFTTHYPELLDCVHRKDNVYFVVRDNKHWMHLVKYSDRIARIENKKSEVFLSNFIDGTAPNYSDVRALREEAKRLVLLS
ncbi:MAG: ATP-binding protein [Atopobiaceae bacterium]|nr:ATP-binding protein [Atopobiaceae bacterium]